MGGQIKNANRSIGSDMTPQKQIVFAMLFYGTCSSTLLLLNKMAVFYIPAPSFVMLVQLIATSLFVVIGSKLGKLEADEFEIEKIKPYCYYVMAFAAGTYCNMRALAASNVETVIVFRSCSPLIVSFLDYLFLGRTLPTTRSWISMLIIGFGASMYVMTDSEFTLNGFSAYYWTFLYLGCICFEMTYGKKIIRDVSYLYCLLL